MARYLTLFAALSGFLAVGMGAFGAHALKDRLPVHLMAAYQTGVLYHLVHTLALLAVAQLVSKAAAPSLTVAGWAFAAGIVLFSGSLYALSLSGVRMLGAITPLGGVAWLVAWASVAHWAFWYAER